MPFPSFLRWLTPFRRIQEEGPDSWDTSENDLSWRSLSSNPLARDTHLPTHLQTLYDCYEAYNTNPIAFAIIEITTNFVLGKGLTISANHPAVQRLLLNFWHDPDNHMDTRVYSLCTELALYGEQFIRFYVNPLNGKVKIRQIDPSIIDQIEVSPDDVETIQRFHRATNPIDATTTDGEWLIAGQDMLQFSINKVSNALRGQSDLATLLPWLQRYKDWLVDRVYLNKYKGAFLWDVELQGADRATIQRKQREHAIPPEPGSIIIHNESERWTAIRPEINASDAAADGRALKLMLAIGAQIPEHYLAEYCTPVKIGEYCTSILGSISSLSLFGRTGDSLKKRFSSFRWMEGKEKFCVCTFTSPLAIALLRVPWCSIFSLDSLFTVNHSSWYCSRFT